MPRRRNPQLLLPLDRPGDTPSPTVFISYSHDSPIHVERVELLAGKLGTVGLRCEIDKGQISPPQGWPLWMQQQIEHSDFVLVVCTEKYARRFTGCESRGTGKGATWEGRLINQCLYESAENRRFIPVVFCRHDIDHIPLVLKGATHYDVSTAEGYSALHQALTRLALTTEHPERSFDPRTTPPHTPRPEIGALLRRCPDPLPVGVLARAVDQDTATIAKSLRQLRQAASVDSPLTPPASAVASSDDGVLPNHVLVAALQAELDFVDNHRDTLAGRAQLGNVLALVEAARDVRAASVQVSRTFRIVQTMLKARGDKYLVLRVARQSIEASKTQGRTRDQVKDQAVSAICGVSWVYQRTGRLAEALVEAERSLKLGEDIGWDRNTAFCCKCIGRLRRMQGEASGEARERTEFLRKSVKSLQEAILRFEQLGMSEEVGDCHSLLARTYLVGGDTSAARDAIARAEERLLDTNSKDYLDLRIVEGDMALLQNPAAAESIYSEALATKSDAEDAQRSEIVARAYLQRGRARAASRQKKRSQEDFERAAGIWESLGDPAADAAHWEIARAADWMDGKAERVLMETPLDVRARAARMITADEAARPVQWAQRGVLPEQYLRGVISKAKERVRVDRPEW